MRGDSHRLPPKGQMWDRRKVLTHVFRASEEASTNVQSVASATEELTSSVNEISRQVQESARGLHRGHQCQPQTVPLDLKILGAVRFRLMVKRGPWSRPRASEREA